MLGVINSRPCEWPVGRGDGEEDVRKGAIEKSDRKGFEYGLSVFFSIPGQYLLVLPTLRYTLFFSSFFPFLSISFHLPQVSFADVGAFCSCFDTHRRSVLSSIPSRIGPGGIIVTPFPLLFYKRAFGHCEPSTCYNTFRSVKHRSIE